MSWLNSFNNALYHVKHKPCWDLKQAEKELSVMPENVLGAEERDLILRLFKAEDNKTQATEALQDMIGSYWGWVHADR